MDIDLNFFPADDPRLSELQPSGDVWEELVCKVPAVVTSIAREVLSRPLACPFGNYC